jgi:hypothetical protein
MKGYFKPFLPIGEQDFEVFLYDWLYRHQRKLNGQTPPQIMDSLVRDLFS